MNQSETRQTASRNLGTVTETRSYNGETLYRLSDRVYRSGYTWYWDGNMGSLREMQSLVDENQTGLEND